MPQACRLHDNCTGHGCWVPRPNDQGSPNVYINGRNAHRVGDHWAIHCCPVIPECHDSVLADGSPNVYVNGIKLGRVGDPVACGSLVAEGSPNVFVNGG